MRNYIISVLLLLFAINGFSQSRWYTSTNLDFVFPNTKDYFYNDSNNRIIEDELTTDGFLLNSFGVQGDYNYMLFNKLSLGVVAGFQMQTEPNFEMIKLGAVLRYFFIDKDNVYVYLQDSKNFSLNKNEFNSGNNFRIGMGFPILKREKYNILINLFWEQNYFKLDGAGPLLNQQDEIPRSLTVKSYGISFGVKF